MQYITHALTAEAMGYRGRGHGQSRARVLLEVQQMLASSPR